MSLYSFKVQNDPLVRKWLAQTEKRSADENLLKNPYNWKFFVHEDKQALVVFILAEPVYFNYSIFGWFTALTIFAVAGFTFWVLPFVFLGCLGIFWTAEPLYLFTKKALRKIGYKGEIKRLRLKKAVMEVLF